jgi:hypothetical protein
MTTKVLDAEFLKDFAQFLDGPLAVCHRDLSSKMSNTTNHRGISK